ncbi:MAG: hypothetical protein QNJ73_00290 [Gammaproteobacteria bacterium]|nr:hypothetical protein [Gammaproteobacteria bacterium]
MTPRTSTLRFLVYLLLVVGVAGPVRAGDAEVIALAQELASDKIFRMPGRNDQVLGTLKSSQQTRRLPAAAYEALIMALNNRAMSNRYFAIEALATMPADDPRHDAMLDALVNTLAMHDHQHTRSAVILALASRPAAQPLPPAALATIENAALTDPYMTVRMDALELLRDEQVVPEVRDRLAQSLVTELIQPTSDLWERSRGLRQHKGLQERGVRLLRDWYEHPYPAFVVDAFVAHTRAFDASTSLVVLEGIRVRGELTPQQRDELLRIASSEHHARARPGIYRMLGEIQDDAAAAEAVSIMQTGEDRVARLRAAYGVQSYYADRPIPAEVAAVAHDVMRDSGDEELRGMAADLVARGPGDREAREAKLIDAVKRHDRIAGIEQALVDLYGPGNLQALVTRYADDESLSPYFRASLIRRLEKSADGQLALGADTQSSLRRAAADTSNYWLVETISDTYETADLRLSWQMFLKRERNHFAALSLAWLTCMAANLFFGLASLYWLFSAPVGSNRKAAGQFGLLFIWLVLVVAILGAAAAAVVSSLGHTSSPPVSQVLTWSIPLYLVTVMHVVFALSLRRRARARKPQREAAAYAPAG